MHDSTVRFDWKWCLASFGLLLAHYFVVFPLSLAFDLYVSHDPGWGLGLDAAWCGGLTPAVDVEYYYGLLTIAIDRVWFWILGRTPQAQTALIGLCVVGIQVGILLVARSLSLSRAARWFILFSVPIAVMPINFPSPAHALEAAFLSFALGLQAQRRLALALVMTVMAVYLKPAIGYLHGLLLVIQILLVEADGTSWRMRFRRLLPATLAAVATGAGLIVTFGLTAVLKTLFPVATAAKVYAADHFGLFFGVGRRFLLPDNPTWAYYVFTPAGCWILATVVLLLAVVISRRWPSRAEQYLAITAAVLHLVFICFLFGNEYSWLYYPFYLTVGVSVLLNHNSRDTSRMRARLARVVLIVLTILAVTGQTLRTYFGSQTWSQTTYAPGLGGTFIFPSELAFWKEVQTLAGRHRVFVTARSGGVTQILPEIASPNAWYLLRPIALPQEVEAVRRKIAEADFLVMPKNPPSASVHRWPEFEAEVAMFVPIAESQMYFLLGRQRNPPAPIPKSN